MLEDSEDSPVEIEVEDESVLQEVEPTITFTETEVMVRNELSHSPLDDRAAMILPLVSCKLLQ